MVAGGVPEGLDISVRPSEKRAPPAGPSADRWNRWIFSVNGNGEFEAEESTRERSWGVELGADRITQEWKITFGASSISRAQQFDLDEDEPFTSESAHAQLNWLVVRGLGEHWSVGRRGRGAVVHLRQHGAGDRAGPGHRVELLSLLDVYAPAAPRVKYAAGARRARYYEETLFGKTGSCARDRSCPPRTNNANRGAHSRAASSSRTSSLGSTRIAWTWKATSRCASRAACR